MKQNMIHHSISQRLHEDDLKDPRIVVIVLKRTRQWKLAKRCKVYAFLNHNTSTDPKSHAAQLNLASASVNMYAGFRAESVSLMFRAPHGVVSQKKSPHEP